MSREENETNMQRKKLEVSDMAMRAGASYF